MNKFCLYLCLFLALALVSCKKEGKMLVIDEKGKEVPFEMEISAPEADKFLYLYRYDGADRLLVDSFKTETGGKFKAIVKTSEPYYYVLDFYGNGNTCVFLINEAPVSMKVDAEWKTTVVGGEDNVFHDEFSALNDRITGESQMLREQFQMAETPEAKTEIEQKYDAFVARVNSDLTAFVGRAKNSLVAISASSMLNPDESLPLMLEVASGLLAKYPNSKMCKQFKEDTDKLTALAKGQMSPDFELKTPDGKSIMLSKMRGKYVLIDFWASWCGPCRQENPNVIKVYEKYKAKGFEILGVSVDEDTEAWKEAITADKLPWPHVLDEGSAVSQIYNVSGIPFTVLLDKEGKIIAKGLRAEALEKKLAELL